MQLWLIHFSIRMTRQKYNFDGEGGPISNNFQHSCAERAKIVIESHIYNVYNVVKTCAEDRVIYFDNVFCNPCDPNKKCALPLRRVTSPSEWCRSHTKVVALTAVG